jgi:hypothetical protein
MYYRHAYLDVKSAIDWSNTMYVPSLSHSMVKGLTCPLPLAQFEKVEWSLTLLHSASFMRAYETFWFLSEDERVKIVSPTAPSSATGWGEGFRASFLPPASDYSMGSAKLPMNASSSNIRRVSGAEGNSVTPSWISLFLAVLCVSLERLGYWDAKVRLFSLT